MEQLNHTSSIRNFYSKLLYKKAIIFSSLIIAGALMLSSSVFNTTDTADIEAESNNAVSDVLAHIPGGWLTVIVQKGNSLASIFAEKNLSSTELRAIAKLPQAKYFKKLSAGERVHLLITPNNQVAMLAYALDPSRTLVFKKGNEKGFEASLEKPNVQTKVSFADVLINDNLSIDRQKAGLSSALTTQLASIFSSQLDMKKVQPGDHFMVLYNILERDGKKIKDDAILAAKFVSHSKHRILQAFRFSDSDDHSGYYTLDGLNLQGSLSRKPVKGGHISSPFTGNRFHPILHRHRAHLGVDYAVPYGSPISSVGEGKIVFRGRKGGYGNIIIIDHGHGYTTRYGHMSRFAKNLSVGSKVHQGQTIGFVGTTGYATGPHVHFEIRVNGVAKNPLTVALPSVYEIPTEEKHEFAEKARNLLAKMESIYEDQMNG